MNRTGVYATVFFIMLLASAALFGIFREAEVSGKTNGMSYFFMVAAPLSIAAGLAARIYLRNSTRYILLKCFLVVLLTSTTLGFLGKIHYEDLNRAVNWVLSIILPIETGIVLSGIVFLLLLIVKLISGIGSNRKF